MKPVWVVDDDRAIRWVFEKALTREGINFAVFDSMVQIEAALSQQLPAVIVSDIRLGGESGLEFLVRVKRQYPQIPVIIMTAYSDLDSAVAAFQNGAFEYLAKPFDVEQMIALIQRALREASSQNTAPESVSPVPDLLGRAPAMQEVFRAIGRLSHSSATVLITGESGTGKELIARALHRHSPRADKSFIALNTAAIPRDLLESELFGHERGAFTGAHTQRKGRFEEAEGGTLFLDEIGDMPIELQTRLLRVLSDGNFYRVGGKELVKSHVRIIAATHQDLELQVQDGLFRADLYHRLNVIRLRVPALRERKEDISLLVQHFLQCAAAQMNVETKKLSVAALERLSRFSFPGNVRQLENFCHWMTIMGPLTTIEEADLPPEILDVQPKSEKNLWQTALSKEIAERLRQGENRILDTLLPEFEQLAIDEALKASGGSKIEAAQRLGWGRNTLTRKIQQYDE